MHRIWFLTGSQGLYGEDVVNQVEGNAPSALQPSH